jgi:alkylhydroperoxidase family enzyme
MSPAETPGGPWIRILRRGEESAELRRAYEQLGIAAREADNILAVHSLHPESLIGHYALYRTLMYGESPLSRAEREMIAVAVSARNRCHY